VRIVTAGLSPRLAAVVEALPLRPDSQVLEVGCGPGAAARAVAERLSTGRVLGIDRSAKAIAQATSAGAGLIAAGRLELRQVAVEDFVLQPGDEPSTWSSPYGWVRWTDGTRTPGSRRCDAWPPPWRRTAGCWWTAATRCGRSCCHGLTRSSEDGCHIAGPCGAVETWSWCSTDERRPTPPWRSQRRPTGAARVRDERKRVPVRRTTPDAVRADLEQVFRRDYPLVVAVAARVLGSREAAEDVAQDVFLSVQPLAVSAGEARGWLSVAAAHTALNALRAGRRRATREETAAAAEDVVVSDVAETVVTWRSAAGCAQRSPGSPTSPPSPSCCGTAA
jgi:hypothetical protein